MPEAVVSVNRPAGLCFNGGRRDGHAAAPEDTTVRETPAASGTPDPTAGLESQPARRPAVAVLALGAVVLVVAVSISVAAGTGSGGSNAPATALPPPRLVDVAASSGIVHAYSGDYPYVVGGGVAAFDCDEDGRSDLYLAGGEARAGLFRNRTPAGGDVRFEAVSDDATDLTQVTGAYPLDIDADGHVDLAVLRLGEDVILRGLGDCRFERANETFGIDGGDGWTVAFSAAWEDESARPTLAFGDYLELDPEGEPMTTCADNALLRADGPMYGQRLTLAPGWCSLSLLFSDWDRSGRRDLRVSNDRHYYRDGEEQLWRIEAGQAPRLYTRDDGWARLQVWGMGIASQDLTGDGFPDIYLTSQGDNKLQTLVDGAAKPVYADIALRLGITAHRPYAGDDHLPSTAWHPEFGDVNNDGFIDLFISKGNVGRQTEHAAKDPSNLFIGQADGAFVEGAEAAGITRFGLARGAALVDLDLDGLLDLVQVVRNANVEVWRNVGASAGTTEATPMGHWIALDLRQPGANVDAIGAWIETRVGDHVSQRERTVGGGHASGQLGWMHVGLGEATSAEVRVTWPDGTIGPWLPVAADSFATIERGAPEVEPWAP